MEQQYEDEIDLMDYLEVILKKKTLILTLFLAAIIIAGVFSFFSPKVYKIDVVLEVGQIGGAIVETPSQVIEKINNDVYGVLVREKLEIPEKEYPKIKTENPEDTGLVVLTIESNNPQRAKNILGETINLILEEHQVKFDERVLILEEEIAKIEKELEFLKYNKVYADWAVAQLQIELLNRKKQLTNSEMTKIIKTLAVSEKPIKPKPLFNMTIAGILGLFIGMFSAFGKEWWERNKVN